jgi:hypothetical protein
VIRRLHRRSSATPPAPEPHTDPGILAAYQVLAARAQANRSTTWQVPTLTLAAQAFLIGVAAQLQAIPSVRIVLAITILLIGGVSLFLQFKIGLYTTLDTYLLDRFEERLLAGENARYRLHHSRTTSYRAARFSDPSDDPVASPQHRLYWRLSAPLRVLPLALAWGGLQLLITLVGASVPVLPLMTGGSAA